MVINMAVKILVTEDDVFLRGGLVVGGGLGFGIPFAISSKKQREEDEKRL